LALDDDDRRTPVGQQADAVRVALVRPISSRSRLAAFGPWFAHRVAYSGLNSTDLDMIVLLEGVASPI